MDRQFLFIVLGAAALAILVAMGRAAMRPRVPASPYRRKGSLFSRDERRFYDALRQATGDRFLVFAQMRLIDLVEVPRGRPGSPFWPWATLPCNRHTRALTNRSRIPCC